MAKTISAADWEELEQLPHGTVVTIPGRPDRLTMNRDDMPDPGFECHIGEHYDGWLRPNNVFAFYGVEHVQVSA